MCYYYQKLFTARVLRQNYLSTNLYLSTKSCVLKDLKLKVLCCVLCVLLLCVVVVVLVCFLLLVAFLLASCVVLVAFACCLLLTWVVDGWCPGLMYWGCTVWWWMMCCGAPVVPWCRGAWKWLQLEVLTFNCFNVLTHNVQDFFSFAESFLLNILQRERKWLQPTFCILIPERRGKRKWCCQLQLNWVKMNYCLHVIKLSLGKFAYYV